MEWTCLTWNDRIVNTFANSGLQHKMLQMNSWENHPKTALRAKAITMLSLKSRTTWRDSFRYSGENVCDDRNHPPPPPPLIEQDGQGHVKYTVLFKKVILRVFCFSLTCWWENVRANEKFSEHYSLKSFRWCKTKIHQRTGVMRKKSAGHCHAWS